ncbi:MAG TPA: BamA/TamA family outer membrane protein [Gemmatimonadales bacterium]|jgi:outer membrane protein insertion porin family/translocation and assembly module TamA
MRAVVAGLCALLFPPLLAAALQAQEPDQRVVRQLDFSGNRAIPDEVLAAAISTTRSSWFARAFLIRLLGLGEKRYFNEEEFPRDVVRLHVLYRRSGFPNAKIDTTVVRDPENVWITFRIQEGEPMRVVSLDVAGMDSLPAWLQRLALLDLPLQEGDPFNRYLMQASADSIERRLRDRGYPSATVFSGFEADRPKLIARVTLEVDPSRRAVIGTVDVVGVRRLDTALVRDLLVARPGRRYSQDELLLSQQNLYKSDLFRYATVNIDSTEFQPGADTVPLLVQVNESRRRRIRGSLGYGTEDCFRGGATWTTRNFLGSNGRLLDLTGRVSKVGVGTPTDWGLREGICGASKNDAIGSSLLNYTLSATVRRPAFLSATSNLSVSLYNERRSEFQVYLRRETGTTVTLRREQLRRRIPLSLAYNLSYGRTEATEVSFCASFNACTDDVVNLLRQNRVLATLTGTASVPRVNNVLDPSRGSLKTLEVTVSSRFLGSAAFQQFTRVVADAAWYRPLARDVVLSWHVRGGTIFSPTVDVASERGAFIPPEQRFYAGGPSDVRGFKRNELGPVVYVVSKREVDSAQAQNRGINPDSVQVSATGGNALVVGNVELRVPSPIFGSRLRLAAFVDAGGAWQRGERDPVIRVTPGIGIRLGTPLGPARLDIAYNPYRLQSGPLFQFDSDGDLTPVGGQEQFVLDRDGKLTYHFAVGQPF